MQKLRLKRKLRDKRGKKRQPRTIFMVIKNKWVREKIKTIQATRVNSAISNNEQALGGMIAKKWARQKWDERWKRYFNIVPVLRKTPAYK